jgi:hypothetical protein
MFVHAVHAIVVTVDRDPPVDEAVLLDELERIGVAVRALAGSVFNSVDTPACPEYTRNRIFSGSRSMSNVRTFRFHCLMCFAALVWALAADAAQIDIHGPSGSVAFGSSVTVLPNGNFVVADPHGPVSNIGAVYLYSASGTLISTLTGSTANDRVGSGSIAIVGDSNFVVMSPFWSNASAAMAGAVTWVNGNSGLNGFVSTANSLVGSNSNDVVGLVVPLNVNGNYIVQSSAWNGGVGASTWCSGTAATAGAVSAANSLVGSTSSDHVGQSLLVLENGNYVVPSSQWNNGMGAATWGDGTVGVKGIVSAANSLIGSSPGDQVGIGGAFLNNGNYVIGSPLWSGGLGAATWANGTTAISGTISSANSLIGSTPGDNVGNFVSPLTNGNYVVGSPAWNGGVPGNALGAATLGNGLTGTTGTVSIANSLIGTTTGDRIGVSNSVPLSNGNYVVVSPNWNDGVPDSQVGATTWCSGSTGCTGPVLPSNSLFGTQAGDGVNIFLHPLSNGNYVVTSPSWSNTPGDDVGAATWGNGSTGITGAISSGNSLVGSTANQGLGSSLTALTNGDYVIVDANGAIIRGDGVHGTTGISSAANSLVDNTTGGSQLANVVALTNGNYVVSSPGWNNNQGSATWANGVTGLTGIISAANSLIGMLAGDHYGSARSLPDGNYVVESGSWNGGVGAITLASGKFRVKGTVQPWNSVIGTAASGGQFMNYGYDATRQRLVVGRPSDNIVSLFAMDQIFAGDFEP